MKLPHVKMPCKDCPFRKDTLKGWLGSERIKEILAQKSFVCHKKIELQCAGHMIIKKEKNDFFQLANRLKIDLNLSGNELIFDSENDCIKHHKK